VPLVTLRSPLAELVGDRTVEIGGSTVGEAIGSLEREHPKIKGWVLDESGSIRRHVNVFIDGERVTEDASVAPDARIDIIHAITGGSRGT
jgi:molybdopterin synthase sulfur carrier subunit